MKTKSGSTYTPQAFLIKRGEQCPGRFMYQDRDIPVWFTAYEEASAFPGAFSMADTESRTAEALVVIESEVRAIEAAANYENMSRSSNG